MYLGVGGIHSPLQITSMGDRFLGGPVFRPTGASMPSLPNHLEIASYTLYTTANWRQKETDSE